MEFDCISISPKLSSCSTDIIPCFASSNIARKLTITFTLISASFCELFFENFFEKSEKDIRRVDVTLSVSVSIVFSRETIFFRTAFSSFSFFGSARITLWIPSNNDWGVTESCGANKDSILVETDFSYVTVSPNLSLMAGIKSLYFWSNFHLFSQIFLKYSFQYFLQSNYLYQ